MTMRTTLISVLVFASTAAVISAHAETYQWKDASGRTVVSDTPPPGSAKVERMLGGAPQGVTQVQESEKTSEKPAAPQTTAEKDMAFKKRQQEAKEKAEQAAKEQAAARDKQENCERARRNVAALEANQPVATFDEKGERQLLNAEQRQQEIERARRFMSESCK